LNKYSKQIINIIVHLSWWVFLHYLGKCSILSVQTLGRRAGCT